MTENIANGAFILILGGARSGKSSHAQRLGAELGGSDVLYVATAQPSDDEMRRRIQRHQEERPPEWHTLEAPRHPGRLVAELPERPRVVLLDCLTLLASNVVTALDDETDLARAEAAVVAEATELLEAWQRGGSTWLVVSNEVGLGLVPPYPLGRVYRDALGRANQYLAARATSVLFMVAGLPLRVK